MTSTRTERLRGLTALTLATAALATAAGAAHAALTLCPDPDICTVGGTPGPNPPPPPGSPPSPPPAPAPAIPDLRITGPDSIVEGDTSFQNVSFLIGLGAPFSGLVSLQLASVDVTASGIVDYGSFVLDQGVFNSAEIQLTVPVLGDLLDEGNETFKIVVRNVSANGFSYVGTIEKLFTIIDNDATTPPAGTVPEPGSGALAGGALLALAWAGQRARRRGSIEEPARGRQGRPSAATAATSAFTAAW